MSTFLLSNNGKVGVYGNGDRVIGNSGTEKALIMNGATNVVVDNSVEEIHVANDMTQYTVRVDANTNQVSLLSGTDVVATFAPNAAGVKIFSSSGMSVIKFNVDPTTGEGTFTADNGATGGTVFTLPTDSATALPADAIDASQTSENAGGVTPDPTPTEEGITVEDAAKGLANGTITTGNYILEDSVTNLNGATYAVVNGAKSITVADTVKNLKADDAANALALASSVSVEDALQTLALNDPFDFGGKPTTLLVKSAPVSNSKINLGDVTVAEASGAQAKIDAFIARTDVTYADGVKKPTSVTVTDWNIVDNATNLINGDASVIAMAGTVTVEDSVANIAQIPTATFADVDKVTVNDSLLNISQANEKLVDEIFGKTSSSSGTPVNHKFAATDTTDATMFFGGNFGGSSNPTIDVSKLTGDNASMTIMLDADVANTSASTLDFSTANPFGDTLSSKVDLTIVGSKFADTITLTGRSNDSVIDGGLGHDTITLGKGADIVVLGTGITSADDYLSVSATSGNDDSISGFHAKTAGANDKDGIDQLDFQGFLDGFDSGDFATLASGNGNISGDGFNGKILAIQGTNAKYSGAEGVSSLFSNVGVGEGNQMILITGDDSNSYVWYVADTNNDAMIDAKEIKLVATLDSVTVTDLSNANIA